MTAYNIALEELKVLSTDGANELLAEQPKRFCRAYMKTTSKCELVVNNLAETFNGYILEARSKPIVDMLEDIRVHLMSRMFTKKRWMQKAKDDICPRIRKKLEKNKEYARGCTVVASNDNQFQVGDVLDTLVVKLNEGTCSCQWWDHYGIPCSHAVACCNWLRVPPENYIHKWLTKDTYLAAYSDGIKPIEGEQHWDKVDFPLLPPGVKKGAGRPRRVRRKDPSEKEQDQQKRKLTKHGAVMTCSLCMGKNHNKRSCPNKNKQPSNQRGGNMEQQGTKGSGSSKKKKQVNNNATQQTTSRGRGRPRKNSNTILHEKVPSGVGVYISSQSSNVYLNVSVVRLRVIAYCSEFL